MPDLEDLTYEKKLKEMQLTTIKERRERENLIQSLGAYIKRYIASPTLRDQLQRSSRASPNASSLPIPINSQQDASTCPATNFVGRLHSRFSLSEITGETESASG